MKKLVPLVLIAMMLVSCLPAEDVASEPPIASTPAVTASASPEPSPVMSSAPLEPSPVVSSASPAPPTVEPEQFEDIEHLFDNITYDRPAVIFSGFPNNIYFWRSLYDISLFDYDGFDGYIYNYVEKMYSVDYKVYSHGELLGVFKSSITKGIDGELDFLFDFPEEDLYAFQDTYFAIEVGYEADVLAQVKSDEPVGEELIGDICDFTNANYAEYLEDAADNQIRVDKSKMQVLEVLNLDFESDGNPERIITVYFHEAFFSACVLVDDNEQIVAFLNAYVLNLPYKNLYRDRDDRPHISGYTGEIVDIDRDGNYSILTNNIGHPINGFFEEYFDGKKFEGNKAPLSWSE